MELDHVRGIVDEMKIALNEAPLRRGGGMRYAPLALPRRRLLLSLAEVAFQRKGFLPDR